MDETLVKVFAKGFSSSDYPSNAIERFVSGGSGNCFQQRSLSPGNDLLYHLCKSYPLVDAISNGTIEEDATDREEAFANQMWLVGRSYAASPQRYSYTISGEKGGKSSSGAKPNEGYIKTEGYESFFTDVVRMMLREEYHDEENPLACFRGEKEDLRKYEPLNDLISSDSVVDAYMMLSRIDDFRASVEKLRDDSQTFSDGWSFDSETKTFSCSGETLDLAKKITKCVIWFTLLLNATRLIRDMAIIGRVAKSDESSGCLGDKIDEWKETVRKGKQSLNISFSSKFLHFHLPSHVFIFDGISEKKLRETLGLSRQTGKCLRDMADEIEKELSGMAGVKSCEKTKERTYAYLVHVVKECALASKMRAHGRGAAPQYARLNIPVTISITRDIDWLVMSSVI